MNKHRQLKIGTRGSPLALMQARMTQQALVALEPAFAADAAVAIEVIKTKGDHILDRPLSEVGGKGLFTKEIEDRLLTGEIDLAVHSMKDMATSPPEALIIAAMLPRADPRDALIAGHISRLADLPEGAHVGTASLRRAAQIKARRPDIRISTLRGSVQTRLQRVEDGAFDATLLAKAGLDRLGLTEAARHPIETDEMLPAVAQAAIGIQCRVDDEQTRQLLERLDDGPTHRCVEIERAFMAVLDGSCHTPIAGYAEHAGDDQIRFRGLLARPDGSEVHRDVVTVSSSEAVATAREMGARFKSQIGPDFFAV